jgi:hypothetical protein
MKKPGAYFLSTSARSPAKAPFAGHNEKPGAYFLSTSARFFLTAAHNKKAGPA